MRNGYMRTMLRCTNNKQFSHFKGRLIHISKKYDKEK